MDDFVHVGERGGPAGIKARSSWHQACWSPSDGKALGEEATTVNPMLIYSLGDGGISGLEYSTR